MYENAVGTHLSQVVLSQLPEQKQTAKGVRHTMSVIFELLCLTGELVHILILNAANLAAAAHIFIKDLILRKKK